MASQPQNHEQDWRKTEFKVDRFFFEIAFGIFLVIVAVLIGFALFPNDRGFQGNLYTTIIGVLITIFVLDRRAERRDEKREEEKTKERLLREIRSIDNATTLLAIAELRAKGWHKDGTLEGKTFAGANLQGARLDGFNFKRANLSNANLQGVILNEANLSECELSMANLQQAVLFHINLSNASLTAADLRKSLLYLADLRGAMLLNCNLLGTDLTDSNLEDTQFLESVTLDFSTRMPDNLPYLVSQVKIFSNRSHPRFWRSSNPRSPAYRGNTTPK